MTLKLDVMLGTVS